MPRCISSVECLSYDTSFIVGNHDGQITPPLEGEAFLHDPSSSESKASEQRTYSPATLSSQLGPSHVQSRAALPSQQYGLGPM